LVLYHKKQRNGLAVTLIIDLPGNKEAALKARAKAEGVSAEEFAQRIITRELEREDSGSEPFWKSFTRELDMLTDAAFDHLPEDAASEHDHYIHGSPKKNP
jgi:plasmid stability protein